jgi:hypothetical protein
MKENVIPLDVYGVTLGSPYLYVKDDIFKRRANQYRVVKNGNAYIINAHKSKSKLSLISAHHPRRLIKTNKTFVLLFFERRSNKEKERCRLVHPCTNVITTRSNN